jgi:hypothetical protein
VTVTGVETAGAAGGVVITTSTGGGREAGADHQWYIPVNATAEARADAKTPTSASFFKTFINSLPFFA